MMYFQVSFTTRKEGMHISTYVASPSEDKALDLFHTFMTDIQYTDEYTDATIDGPISEHTFYFYGPREVFFRSNSGTLLTH